MIYVSGWIVITRIFSNYLLHYLTRNEFFREYLHRMEKADIVSAHTARRTTLKFIIRSFCASASLRRGLPQVLFSFLCRYWCLGIAPMQGWDKRFFKFTWSFTKNKEKLAWLILRLRSKVTYSQRRNKTCGQAWCHRIDSSSLESFSP